MSTEQKVIFTITREGDDRIKVNIDFEPGLCGEANWANQTGEEKDLHIKAVRVADFVMEALENE